ncbi:Predicted ATP-dependent endonuclease of the OLD family, contains P-loop ATPase and TOPRIM domains [Kandleria vitulina]|uniref:ATP-dependent nuclease n=1 Tax=Kandleria vitulina TaxID=1630 RepID=UPI00088933D1|nr:ATP-binding protein [Kandleria vitulina]SDL32369.1 Predicted ATP-dependent endonuclease of the OLD family, contains P-loop ATPase and TOPRIM domains [Kandleria vitulina]
MKLVEFSVENYRSITAANKIKLKKYTVLVGKNNEGKSNLLSALNVSILAIDYFQSSFRRSQHSVRMSSFFRNKIYDWERDFPVQYQENNNSSDSVFKLTFKLNDNELSDFQKETGLSCNQYIPITIKMKKDNYIELDIPKKGSSAYKEKSIEICGFISEHINFNYIGAIRTEKIALDTLNRVINDELLKLDRNAEYREAMNKIDELKQEVLDEISNYLLEPMKVFLPNLKSIKMENEKYHRRSYFSRRSDVKILLDDGVLTSIEHKGDGIKSLVTLSILKERNKTSGSSLIAIEEPESHLHPGAIHNLVDVIHGISDNNQVIISTHNPLFVQRNDVMSNIMIDNGKACAAVNIKEIRDVLGIWPSDNLKNSRFVLVVEGESDKKILLKILPALSEKIGKALKNNMLAIKVLGGASNLVHDLADLQYSMCEYVVLLDNDKAGDDAIKKAKAKNLLKNEQLRKTICRGMNESEIEDCIKPAIYVGELEKTNSINIEKNKKFRNNKNKWSKRMGEVFSDQGANWDDEIESKTKNYIADIIFQKAECSDISDILIEEKSGFLEGLVLAIENMLRNDCSK